MNAASPVTESPAPLFSPEFVRNPYPTYAQHREGPRLQPLPDRPGLWLVFSYALHRQHIRHFGFGGDAHTCLGATLARLESQTAVRALLSRFPRLSPAAGHPDWSSTFGFRGLNSLSVNLDG